VPWKLLGRSTSPSPPVSTVPLSGTLSLVRLKCSDGVASRVTRALSTSSWGSVPEPPPQAAATTASRAPAAVRAAGRHERMGPACHLCGRKRRDSAYGRPVSARVPPTLLVLAAIVSVQCGGALATKLFDDVGPGGAVFLRLLLSAVMVYAVARPRVRGRSAP